MSFTSSSTRTAASRKRCKRIRRTKPNSERWKPNSRDARRNERRQSKATREGNFREGIRAQRATLAALLVGSLVLTKNERTKCRGDSNPTVGGPGARGGHTQSEGGRGAGFWAYAIKDGRGSSREDVEKVLGGNVRRVLADSG